MAVWENSHTFCILRNPTSHIKFCFNMYWILPKFICFLFLFGIMNCSFLYHVWIHDLKTWLHWQRRMHSTEGQEGGITGINLLFLNPEKIYTLKPLLRISCLLFFWGGSLNLLRISFFLAWKYFFNGLLQNKLSWIV